MKIEGYPIGTKAHAATGGYWERVALGWKWCTGTTFPRPGGDVISYEIPNQPVEPTPELPMIADAARRAAKEIELLRCEPSCDCENGPDLGSITYCVACGKDLPE